MKFLKEIYFGEKPVDTSGWVRRKSARAVVFDNEGKIAILFVRVYGMPKLPGGEVEEGEDLETALRRECLEEIGCKIEIVGEIGEIIEYRKEVKMIQNAFCFLAKVVDEKGQNQLTQREIDQGVEIRWLTMEEILKLFNKEPMEWGPKYVKEREITFLKEAREFLPVVL